MARTLLLPGDRPLVNLALLGATLASTFFVYWGLHTEGKDPQGALAFSICTVLILGAHEMGHYLLARAHGVATSLPYFIPLPLGFGTLGAVIRIRSRIPDRNALVDIGAAGPIAGLVVAVPVLLYGLAISSVGESPAGTPGFPHPWSALTLGAQAAGWVGEWLGGDAAGAAEPMMGVVVYGDSLLMQGLQWLVFGPIPEGHDVYVHPMVIAGWFGLLVTMLNLCPIGQLDGGHVAYAVFGERARWVGWLAGLGLLFLTLFFSVSWAVWLLVTTRFIGFGHPPVVDERVPLTTSRKLVCAACLVALIVCVVPTPIHLVPVR